MPKVTNKLKNLLRPVKKMLIKFLVISKKFLLLAKFRLSRGLKAFLFLSQSKEFHSFRIRLMRKEIFNNSIKLGFSKFYFFLYSVFCSQQLSIGFIGQEDKSSEEWLRTLHKGLGISTASAAKDVAPVKNIRLKYLTQRLKGDLLLVDSGSQLPSAFEIYLLLFARTQLRKDQTVAAVHPHYLQKGDSNKSIQGYFFDQSLDEWIRAESGISSYSQGAVPNWSLRPNWHSLLISEKALLNLDYVSDESMSLEDEIELASENLWTKCGPILSFPEFSLQLSERAQKFVPKKPPTNVYSQNKVSEKPEKIIFVLPATTLSGGIKVVFEIANGLSEKGLNCEIWSLKSSVAWEPKNVTIRHFPSYASLIQGLSGEQAIKVATWWETADAVFLSSIKTGLPVQFVQEFETWFYPNDLPAQAAVVSSYRPEFRYITTASFQRKELEEIGINPTLIPVGFDSETYREITDCPRESNVILAVGRSFFQKNFGMTKRAWNKISDNELKLWLYGNEPQILSGKNVTYHRFPSNQEVNVLLNRAAVFVQTSIHEGFSLPIIEAMATGSAVITTDSHGNQDFCIDEVNCIIVPQDDDQALAEAIIELINSEEKRRLLGIAGQKTASKYSWSVLLDKYYDYFKPLMKG